MKTILAILMISSMTSAFANQTANSFKVCNMGEKIEANLTFSGREDGSRLELRELTALPDKNYVSTYLKCGTRDGNELFINPVKKIYNVHFEQECFALMESLEANPGIVYEIDTIENNVILVSKTDSTHCSVAGSTVLDI